MCPFMNLAVLCLAASASPALSAPAQYPDRVPGINPASNRDGSVTYPPDAPHQSESLPSNSFLTRLKKNLKLVGKIGASVVGFGLIGGLTYWGYREMEDSRSNKTHNNHTSRAVEGRANAELVEPPLHDHGVDKGLESASDLANRFFDALGTLTGLTATSPGVPKDVSHSQTIEASSVLGKHDFALEDTLYLLPRMLDELD